MRVQLLNFEEGPGVLLLNFEGGPGAPLLNVKGGRGLGPHFLTLRGGPGSWSHFYTMPRLMYTKSNSFFYKFLVNCQVF